VPLSRARAQAVAAALVAAGIRPDRLDVSWQGANQPAVIPRPGKSELRNRRVEMSITG
jgi:outer membrane protein OmpA-like peptidoglycan-associated protein